MRVEEAIKILEYQHDNGNMEEAVRQALAMAIEALRHDVIFEQIKWERDVALDTLEEHGIGLGQKAEYIIPSGDVMFTSEVVYCKDCKHYGATDCQIQESFYGIKDFDFCSYGERKGGDSE